jgi:hypothetical protein
MVMERDGTRAPTQIVPRIPYATPRWPKGDQLVFAASGFVAGTFAPISAAILRARRPYGLAHVDPRYLLVPAVVCGLVLAWKVLNVRTWREVVAWALLGGAGAGFVAAYLSAYTLTLFGHEGIVVGRSALLGVPFGMIFGAILAWPGVAAALIRARRAHDAYDRMLMTLGAWLLFVFVATFKTLYAQGLETVAQTGLLFGASVLGLGAIRRVARVVWFRRVRAGKSPSWVLGSLDELQNTEQLAPLFGSKRVRCDALLVYVGPHRGDAYRGARPQTAVALAPGGAE